MVWLWVSGKTGSSGLGLLERFARLVPPFSIVESGSLWKLSGAMACPGLADEDAGISSVRPVSGVSGLSSSTTGRKLKASGLGIGFGTASLSICCSTLRFKSSTEFFNLWMGVSG